MRESRLRRERRNHSGEAQRMEGPQLRQDGDLLAGSIREALLLCEGQEPLWLCGRADQSAGTHYRDRQTLETTAWRLRYHWAAVERRERSTGSHHSQNEGRRSEERRVGKECRSRW